MGCGGSSTAAQAQSPNTLRQKPTLLTSRKNLATRKRTTRKDEDLLKAVLEQHNALFDSSNVNVGEFVANVYKHAFGIIDEGSGVGRSGECPFASAYEVHLFHLFCCNVCAAWSEHEFGKDQEIDKVFNSQMSSLSEILSFLDIDAVVLPAEIEQNIRLLQQELLFPHWVDAQSSKGEAALKCCLSVGSKWKLEETKAFQNALEAFEKFNYDASACLQAQSSFNFEYEKQIMQMNTQNERRRIGLKMQHRIYKQTLKNLCFVK
jgi:hypothetical protein